MNEELRSVGNNFFVSSALDHKLAISAVGRLRILVMIYYITIIF